VLRHPFVVRLATQLVPAVLVTVVGVVALSNLARMPDAAPAEAPAQTAIATEAVFTAVPRESVDEPAQAASPRPAGAPKGAHATPLPPRKPEIAPRQLASAPAPLPVVQPPEQPQVVAEPAGSDRSMIGTLRSATSTVMQAPRWAARSVTGWFQESAPPRPPASVPQNYQAAM
jgi:hypothetical protein